MEQIPWTHLKIDGERPFSRSARKITGQKKQIQVGGTNRRRADGVLITTRRPQFRKWAITLSGSGYRRPAIDHLFVGDQVTIECPFHLYEDGQVNAEATLRPVAPGSLTYWGKVNDVLMRLEAGDPNIAHTMYRPVLTMMVMDNDSSDAEQDADSSWTLSLEEI